MLRVRRMFSRIPVRFSFVFFCYTSSQIPCSLFYFLWRLHDVEQVFAEIPGGFSRDAVDAADASEDSGGVFVFLQRISNQNCRDVEESGSDSWLSLKIHPGMLWMHRMLSRILLRGSWNLVWLLLRHLEDSFPEISGHEKRDASPDAVDAADSFEDSSYDS